MVEAALLGRRGVGADLNELALFVANVKVTVLKKAAHDAIAAWAEHLVPLISCRATSPQRSGTPRNMHLPQTRWLRKLIALTNESIDMHFRSATAKRFARCVVLNVGQWALNGRRPIPTVADFRDKIAETTKEMLRGITEFAEGLPVESHSPTLVHTDVEKISEKRAVLKHGPADLIVTSPPYPGVHILYHRWQVDGRKESDAPYWISGTNDGQGSSYYNFADRHRRAEDLYFEKAERAFSAVRRVARTGALLAQLVAFSNPCRQLSRYIRMLKRAGFTEARDRGQHRIWRPVPGRSWHAHSKGRTPSSREVFLLHQAD